MVSSCAAFNCTQRFKKNINIKFHRFPKDTALRKQWIIALKRKNFVPSTTTVICSNHFLESDYETNPHGNRVLKKSAVPSIFNFPEHLTKSKKARRELTRNEAEETSTKTDADTKDLPCEHPVGTPEIPNEMNSVQNVNVKNIVTRKRKRTTCAYVGDFAESDLADPVKRRKYWIVSQNIIKKYTRNVKSMQTKILRQKQKIKDLNMLIALLYY